MMRRSHFPLVGLVLLIGLSLAWRVKLDAQQIRPSDSRRVAKDSLIADIQRRVDGSVRETGVLKPRQMEWVTAPINGTILELVAEGSRVSVGDKLLAIDDSELVRELQQTEIRIAKLNAEASATNHSVKAVLQQLELAKRIAKSRKELLILKRKTIAEKSRSGAITADDAAVARAEIELGELEGEFSTQRTLQTLESSITQAESETVGLQAEERVFQSKSQQLSKQIKACHVVAQKEGVVVYSNQTSRRAEPATIEEGAQVRERQTLLGIHEPTQLRLDVGVHESRIAQVKAGQAVLIRFDALPDREFHGKVEHVAAVAMPSTWPNTSIKTYMVSVNITDPADALSPLKLGMTAVAEIDVASRN